MWEEASETGKYSTQQPSPPLGRVTIPCRPQGICFICVRFAWHAECFVGEQNCEWDQCFHIMSQACLSVWWPMTLFSCEGFSPRPVWSTQPLACFNQANTESRQNILRSDLLGSVLFNSCEYLSLQVKCLVSHSRGKYYFGNQRLVRSWCRSRSTRACGFVQGQQWRNALVEQMQNRLVC